MDKERRQIIVKEIDHWRRSKLLPDQYCDFLLNLYSDPDEPRLTNHHPNAVGKAIAAVQKATGMQWFLTFGTFTFISIVVLYFSRFHPLLQIGVIACAVACLLWIGKRYYKRSEAAGLSFTSIGMLTLLGGGLYMFELHGLEQWGWKTSLLGICALFWIGYGIIMRIHVLHFCGWVAALLVYGWLLSQFTASPKWYESQLYWLPLSILFGWGSWFIHRWTKPVSAVLLAVCLITWFMPEIYTLIILKEAAWVQLQIIIKIAIGGALLFSMRKQWMVWIV